MADTPASYSMQEYLEAKRTVDDRALNRRVLDRVTTFLDGSYQDYPRPEIGGRWRPEA